MSGLPVAIDAENVRTRENGRSIERDGKGFVIASYVVDFFDSYWRNPYLFPSNVRCPKADYNNFIRSHHMPNFGAGIINAKPINTWCMETRLNQYLEITDQKTEQRRNVIFECYTQTQADILLKNNSKPNDYFTANLALVNAYNEQNNGLHIQSTSSEFLEQTANYVFSDAHGNYMKERHVPFFASQKKGENNYQVLLHLYPQDLPKPFAPLSAPARHPEQLYNWQNIILQKQYPNHRLDHQKMIINKNFLNKHFYAASSKQAKRASVFVNIPA